MADSNFQLPTSKRRGLAWLPAFILGILLVVVPASLISRQAGAGAQGSGAASLPPAPAFEMPLLRLPSGQVFEAEHFRLGDYQGQGVVINFWAAWCGPCRQEAPVLEAGWRAYRNRGIVFVGVDTWDKAEEARAFLREFEITYPNGSDSDGEIANRYRVKGLPMTFFVTPDGRIHHAHLGALTQATLEAAIEVIQP